MLAEISMGICQFKWILMTSLKKKMVQNIFQATAIEMGGGPLGHKIQAPDIWTPFPILFLFFELWRKNNEAGNSLNAIEHKLVPTRVLNPFTSERATNLNNVATEKQIYKKFGARTRRRTIVGFF